MADGWFALFWLHRNSFADLVTSNHCTPWTKACALCVWKWFDWRCLAQSDRRQSQNMASQPCCACSENCAEQLL